MHAELIAFRIEHHRPAIPIFLHDPHPSRTQADQPRRGGIDPLMALLRPVTPRVLDIEIQVYPTLHRFRLGHLLKEDPGAGRIRIDDCAGCPHPVSHPLCHQERFPVIVPCRRRLHYIVEGGGPERRLRIRIRTVEGNLKRCSPRLISSHVPLSEYCTIVFLTVGDMDRVL